MRFETLLVCQRCRRWIDERRFRGRSTTIFRAACRRGSAGWLRENISGCELRPRYRAVPWRWSTPYSDPRSEEHTSELQSLMRISYAVFCLKKKKNKIPPHKPTHTD